MTQNSKSELLLLIINPKICGIWLTTVKGIHGNYSWRTESLSMLFLNSFSHAPGGECMSLQLTGPIVKSLKPCSSGQRVGKVLPCQSKSKGILKLGDWKRNTFNTVYLLLLNLLRCDTARKRDMRRRLVSLGKRCIKERAENHIIYKGNYFNPKQYKDKIIFGFMEVH